MKELVFSQEFVDSLDELQPHWNSRVVGLCKIDTPSLIKLRDRIEGWYNLIPEGKVKEQILNELRSSDEKLHLSAVWELFYYDYILNNGFEVEFRPEREGLTPDFIIKDNEGKEIIIDVRGVYESEEYEKIEKTFALFLNTITKMNIEYFLGISLEQLDEQSRDIKSSSFISEIQTWVSQLNNTEGEKEFTIDGTTIKVRAYPEKNLPKEIPRVFSHSLGGRSFALPTEKVKDLIEEKVMKYKKLGPVICILTFDALLHWADSAILGSLIGNEVFVSTVGRDKTSFELTRDRKGMITPKMKLGKALNTSLMAVISSEFAFKEDEVKVILKLYPNYWSKYIDAVPRKLYEIMPTLKGKENGNMVTFNWENESVA
jgi:hypothetical protein